MGIVRLTLASSPPWRASELQELAATVGQALPLSTRVGVVSPERGTGCSTVAGRLAAVLAARRPLPVLAVHASSAPQRMLWHLGIEPRPASVTGRGGRSEARTAEQATQGLGRGQGGLYGLDLRSADGSVFDTSWFSELGPASRFFDVVVTDWGARGPQSLEPVLASSSGLCIVCETTRASIQEAVDLADSAAAAGTVAIIAVVDVHRRRPGWLSQMAALSPVPMVRVPHERAENGTRPTPSRAMSPATTFASLRLAAALMDVAASPRTADPDQRAPMRQPLGVGGPS